MTFELSFLAMLAVAYLLFLFTAAWLAESGALPVSWLRHPAVYVLSLGVYASAWALYGSVGFAHDYGYNYLAYYLGLSGAFLIAPVLLAPVLRLVKTHQLGSLADLFAFRYRGAFAGTLVSLIMLLGMQPLLASQIQAVVRSLQVLSGNGDSAWLALGFCVLITVFTLLFGARHITARDKHEGLVLAIALESLLKLLVIMVMIVFVLWQVFDGVADVNHWLAQHEASLQNMYTPLQDGVWHSLVLAFFFSAIVMPFMYQMVFTENLNPRALLTSSWALPLYLCVFAFAVPLVLWASQKLGVQMHPEYLMLGLSMQADNALLPLLVFLGGVSAASGIMIVSTLSLSGMVLNHLVLPLFPLNPEHDIYRRLLWLRRLVIIGILALAYACYRVLGDAHTLSEMGMLTFVATLQFAPGILGLLFWPSATRQGFIAGVLIGSSIWLLQFMLPALMPSDRLELFGHAFVFSHDARQWQITALVGILSNIVVFFLVSLYTRQSPEEQSAANTCAVDNLRRPYRWQLGFQRVDEVITRLSEPLGRMTAEREVRLALVDLGLHADETRPYALRRLRDQLENNLSGLLGPSVAQEILEQHLPVRPEREMSEDIHFIEHRLEDYHNRLTGLAAELDNLRRFHRQTLLDLPIAVCSLGQDREIISWNRAMERLTGVPANSVIGSTLDFLPSPWAQLIADFVANDQEDRSRACIEREGLMRWLSLQKADIGDNNDYVQGSLAVVIEDFTEVHQLESQLAHNERLASIGRLAAGVAHEIGNPVTGIACLAQNLRVESQDLEVTETADQIVEQTQRISRIVQSLVGFSRSGSSQRVQEAVSLHDCVAEAIQLLQLVSGGREYHYQNLLPVDLQVQGDTQKLLQVFVNLLGNARDASMPGDSICITAEQGDEVVCVCVSDQGAGIPEAILPTIFEPFVTTKEPGQGTGLGLALVQAIIEEHHGRIELRNRTQADGGRGVVVEILLPIAEKTGVE